jgi:glc operon protein GlcG
MTNKELSSVIDRMFESIDRQVPAYKNNPADWNISDGNVAVCIIDEQGRVYGKLYGSDKIKQRKFFNVAWRKASQVWITGYKTGEYEKLVFAGKLNADQFGIELPDLMGWEGGQPIELDKETKISVGFSGFRGVNDLAIAKKAAEEAIKGE